MRYRDLVQFEPIETVIKINEADDLRAAQELVRTYVISNRMADQLTNIVLPQLRIDRPIDNKGVLVVGNYGTGKSHLMSLLSALAEHRDLLDLVSNDAVKSAAGHVAGRFKVLRVEIGGTERGLRDIVLGELEHFLAGVGTPYSFPPASQITNNKAALIEAMAKFAERYPDTGLLFVCDEMLDYLRSREERSLILDLGFLREIGEVSADTPFRFIGGLQETLFDNPRFSFVADQLRRVRDRFEQVRIARDDIAYVVSRRLLSKTDEQLARITEHLRRFTKLYPGMAERLDEFARLFPIHPAYIDTFERVYIAEKREVLRTFSSAIRTVLDREVPESEPGLISYDHYWSLLRENPSLRTMQGVGDVVDKSGVLEGRISNAYTRQNLKPMALRIIHALSVHRLTTSDIDAPLGVTAEELRDQLCLWAPIPEADATFLANTVQVALREILRTVSGQYISHNSENGQYYLDLRKTVDFDARIGERGNFMEERDLNRFFFDGLRRLLNLTTSTHVTGFMIWPYELAWESHKVTRPGYLFFGPPDERSTAQPPRDFYIYFLPPFGQSAKPARGGRDEVVLQLHGLPGEFAEIVRRYAGAQALAAESPNHRQEYEQKADEHLRALLTWLRQNLTTHLRIIDGSATRTVQQVLAKTRSSASRDAEELLIVIAAQLLTPHFEAQYPDYPAFGRLQQPVTEVSRGPSALEAVRILAGRGRTNLALAVLDGLKLLDSDGQIKPLESPYARHFLDVLLQRGETQVVNQGDIIEQVAGGLKPVLKDTQFKLEPEWVAVILLSLVYDGKITLNLGSDDRTYDATNIDRVAMLAIDAITDFRFYRRSKALSLEVWERLFDAFGLQTSLLRDEATRDEAVKRLQDFVQAELNRVVEWQNTVTAGPTLWNQPLFTDRHTLPMQGWQLLDSDTPTVTLRQGEVLPRLRNTKNLLEQLARYDRAGKLRNLTMPIGDAHGALQDRTVALRVGEVLDTLAQLQPLTSYLSEAGAVLPADHPWVARAQAVRDELLGAVRRQVKGEQGFDLLGWRSRLEGLKKDYVEAYAAMHGREVLGPADDDRRKKLLGSTRVAQARKLAGIDILSAQDIERWERQVKAIPACREFHPGLLDAGPVCRCGFRPVQSSGGATAAQRLDQFDQQLSKLLERWHAALRQNLASETAQQSIRSMSPTERQPLEDYLAQAELSAESPSDTFVSSVNRSLRGIRTLAIQAEALLNAMQDGGMPCTLQELRERIDGYLRRAMTSHAQENTRLTIERDDV